MNEREVFARAIELADTGQLSAFLAEACGDNPELRDGIERLLEEHAREDSFVLDRPVVDATVDVPNVKEKVGATIGPYKLMEQIGEGGMGVVYVAEQREPVRRRVALKIIKPGMDSKEVMARFAAERQALAMMDHPHIARVLDAGATDTGRLYFVMELVRGVPITEFCDKNKLSAGERLELFMDVCHAIQHAHQKGVIHRDIKPSNVLVTSQDGRPLVKVIDFGVAKAINQQLTEQTIYTRFTQMVGTPLYMSPEQAEMSASDVDTRTDIYALGVLLYELLTGAPPFDKERLKKAAYDEMRRIIREEEPSKPSSKVSTLGASTSTVCIDRGTDARKLSQLLRGDLDWIVMKALDKDRERRYETANGFALDVRRFLDGQAVVAAPPTWRYRARKFVHRHKGPVLAAGLLLCVLLVGIAGTTYGLINAERARLDAVAAQLAESERARGEREAKELADQQRELAEQEKTRAEKLQALAESQRQLAEQAAEESRQAHARAEKRLEQLEKANQILGSIFENLDPNEVTMTDRPLRAILVAELDRAVEQLEGEAIGDPLIVAAMQNRLAVSLLALDQPEKAIFLLKQARQTLLDHHGADDPDTLAATNNLAMAYDRARLPMEALPLWEETHELTLARFGPDDPRSLTTMGNLAAAYQAAGLIESAMPLHEETLNLRINRLGPEHIETLTSMNNLAMGYQELGDVDQAVPLFEDTLKRMKASLGIHHPKTLTCMSNLAAAYQEMERNDLALPLLQESLKWRESTLGSSHEATLVSMNDLASAFRLAGRPDDALPLWEEIRNLTQENLGPEHPVALISLHNLAAGYREVGRLTEALPLMEEALTLSRQTHGSDHPDTLICIGTLAVGYREAGQLDRARPLFKEVFDRRRNTSDLDDPETLVSMNNLAKIYTELAEFDLAIPLLQESLALTRELHGHNHPESIWSQQNLAIAFWQANQLDKSIPLLEEVLRQRRESMGSNHLESMSTQAILGVNYLENGRAKEALELLEEVHEATEIYPMLAWTNERLVTCYLETGDEQSALRIMNERVGKLRDELSSNSPQFAGQLAPYAKSLLDHQQYNEAVPLLRECLAIRTEHQPDSWLTFNTQSMLGEALMGLTEFDEAEPLLVGGHEGMKQRAEQIPPQGKIRLAESLERLVKYYRSTEQPDESAKWQSRLATFRQSESGSK